MNREKDHLTRDFLKEKKVLELLGIVEGTLERLIREKDFPHIKIGQGRLFYEQDVIKWLRLQKRGYNSKKNV